MGNIVFPDNSLLRSALHALADKLPAEWRINSVAAGAKADMGIDAAWKIQAPDGRSTTVLVEAKQHLEPKALDRSVQLAVHGLPVLVVAPFLSPRTQERLRALHFNYLDLTGNVRISFSKPGLYVETHGAEKNPEPTVRERRSLKGAKAGRIIRALCDFHPPFGLRELAKRAAVDAGYASRVVDFLHRDALVTREARGPITSTDWPALLRRWSQEYTPLSRGRMHWYLAPRGLGQAVEKLRSSSALYTLTASWAAAQFAPVAPPRLLMCYTDDTTNLAQALDLRHAEAGSHVVLLTPFDPVVYDRTIVQNGMTLAAPSQIAADLLTSPGRGPNEAEALMEWMREHDDAWRT